MLILKGSTALVTGASKGLGAAYAEALARRGVNLVLTARSGEALQSLARRLEHQYGITTTAIVADLAVPGAARALVQEMDAKGLSIDLLINNAGLGLTGPFQAHDPDRELAVVQVNVQALLGLSHLLGQRMAARGRGGILNIASNAAFMPLPGMAVYAASKAFVLHFTEALRHEMAAGGVTVMAVVPGSTATSFFENTSIAMKDEAFDSVEQVVEGTLRDFTRGRAVSYPGRLSVRLGTLLPRFLPRGLTLAVAAMASAKMGLMSG